MCDILFGAPNVLTIIRKDPAAMAAALRDSGGIILQTLKHYVCIRKEQRLDEYWLHDNQSERVKSIATEAGEAAAWVLDGEAAMVLDGEAVMAYSITKPVTAEVSRAGVILRDIARATEVLSMTEKARAKIMLVGLRPQGVRAAVPVVYDLTEAVTEYPVGLDALMPDGTQIKVQLKKDAPLRLQKGEFRRQPLGAHFRAQEPHLGIFHVVTLH